MEGTQACFYYPVSFRPNPIALSVGRIISIEAGNITISGIEALDGSPVIDIKPYIPGIDSIPGAEYSALTHHDESRIRG